jgi:SHS2 domain-containing protein
MTSIVTDLREIQPKEMVEIVCSEQPFDSAQGGEPVEPDDELLFAAWLNALLYEMATRQMLFGKFDINIKNGRLQAQAWGEKIDLKRHNPTVEVKAATYADLKVQQEKGGNWVAQCIVDV